MCFVCVCVCCHMYTVVCVMQVCNVCVHLEDQMGTQCVYKGSIYGNTMHVQRTNRMNTMCTCTEDQSYGTAYQCLCTVSEVRALYHVRKASYKETQHANMLREVVIKKKWMHAKIQRKITESLVHKLK